MLCGSSPQSLWNVLKEVGHFFHLGLSKQGHLWGLLIGWRDYPWRNQKLRIKIVAQTREGDRRNPSETENRTSKKMIGNIIPDYFMNNREEGRRGGWEEGRQAGRLALVGNRFSATGETWEAPLTRLSRKQFLSRFEPVIHAVYSLLVFWARLTWWEWHGLWN